jgi:3-oxoacyl-[acyl-carrier-protein] synthase II
MHSRNGEAWITGVGLVTSIGEGVEAHLDVLTGRRPAEPSVDETTFAPYPVHPLTPLQLSRQIPKNSDQRQMEGWQKIGVYAAGLALEDAGLKGNAGLLDTTDLVVAAGSGERDTAVDCKILGAGPASDGARLLAAQILPGALRPTLFLAQLSNLLAGNISIVHHVTGSSRTFMGEEMAGLSAIQNAFARVAAGQSRRCLAGGALNAQREDLLLAHELGCNLWSRPYQPIARRHEADGGFVPGSVGAFLVIEHPQSAAARGVSPYCRLTSVRTARCNRASGAIAQTFSELLDAAASVETPAAIFSGASGVEPVTAGELAFIASARTRGFRGPVWTYGDLIGHSVEAHFPAGLALAALALKSGATPAFLAESGDEAAASSRLGRIVVTGAGHWRGEGLALLQSLS